MVVLPIPRMDGSVHRHQFSKSSLKTEVDWGILLHTYSKDATPVPA